MAGLLALAVPLFALLAGGDDLDSTGGGVAAGLGIVLLFVYIAVIVAVYALMWWKVFTKAGEPGWASLVPFYNTWTLVKISGKEWWWWLLFFVPCVYIVVWVIIGLAVAERFGKSTGFAVGLILLPIVFYPILGFGDAQYQGAPAYAGGGGGYPPQQGYPQQGYAQPGYQQQPPPQPQPYTPPPASGAPPAAPPPGQPPTPPPSTPPGGGQSF